MNGFAKLLADLLRPLPRSVISVPAEDHATPPPPPKGADTLHEINARTIARLKDLEGDPAKLLDARLATFTPEKRKEVLDSLAELAKGPTGPLEPGVKVPPGHYRTGTAHIFGKYPLPGAPPRAPRNFLIFINGDPRSGKDTTSFAIEAAFQKRGYLATSKSSIEPVREMLQNAGFDLSAKTEEDRFLLAEVGDRVEEHSGFRSNAAIREFRELVRTGHEINTPVALVLHTREPATMHKIAFGLRDEMSLSIRTLFVSGRGMAVTSNKADAGVRGMVYDDEIRNDGTLAELESRVDSLVGSWTS